MIYYEKDNIIIRSMNKEDSHILHELRLAHGWSSELSVFNEYFKLQVTGELYCFIATKNTEIAGYTTLKRHAKGGPYIDLGFPELSDFNVFEKFRRQGIGNQIMEVVENFASQLNHSITLAVGLHAGYGSAQRLYIKRGYILDGSGVWYQDKPLEPYSSCINNDELVLYFSKKLMK
jgi:GNAT superfamily N-acetyltransferase